MCLLRAVLTVFTLALAFGPPLTTTAPATTDPVLTKLQPDSDITRAPPGENSAMYCGLKRHSCETVNRESDSKDFNETDDINECENRAENLEMSRGKIEVIKTDSSSMADTLREGVSMVLLDSCPAGLDDSELSNRCNKLPGENIDLELFDVIPVIAFISNITYVSRNIFCAICNNVRYIYQTSFTLYCLGTKGLGADSIRHKLSQSLVQCQAFVGVEFDQRQIKFPYYFQSGGNDVTGEDATVRARPCDECPSADNNCTCAQNVLTIQDCVIRAGDGEGNPTAAESDPWESGVTETGQMNKAVQTRVTYTLTVQDGTGDHPGDTCSGEIANMSAVCLKTDWHFRGLIQLVNMTCMTFVPEVNHTSDSRYRDVTQCVTILKKHLFQFQPQVHNIQEIHSDGDVLKTQILIEYGGLVNPGALLESVLRLSVGFSKSVNISAFSTVSNCISENRNIEAKAFAQITQSAEGNKTGAVLLNTSPCFNSQGKSDWPNHTGNLSCLTRVQISKDDFNKVKRSQKFISEQPSHELIKEAVWMCLDWLMEYNEESKSARVKPEVDMGQTWATIICSSISLVALALTFTFKIVSHQSYSLPIKLMMNLMVALFISQLLLLLMAIEGEIWCTTVAILSHYFWLSTFCWMFICALHMYKTFSTSIPGASGCSCIKGSLWCYTITGYGIPILIVVPSAFIHFSAPPSLHIGYGQDICFIREPVANLITFAGPIALILFLNIILFSCTMYHIRKTSNAVQCVQSVNVDSFRIFMKISSLFGFTWIFGYLAIFIDLEVLWYLFTVLNSLQGLYIFIAFGLRDGKEVMQRLKAMLPGRRLSSSTCNTEQSPSHARSQSAQTISSYSEASNVTRF